MCRPALGADRGLDLGTGVGRVASHDVGHELGERVGLVRIPHHDIGVHREAFGLVFEIIYELRQGHALRGLLAEPFRLEGRRERRARTLELHPRGREVISEPRRQYGESGRERNHLVVGGRGELSYELGGHLLVLSVKT